MNRTSLIITLLVVGLVNAAAIWIGFALVSASIARQRFYSSSSTFSTQSVVALSGDRFAIVENGRFVSVYQVGPKREVKRLSDVNVYYRDLQPAKRQTDPSKQIPTPTPTPESTPAKSSPSPTPKP